jgi:hypothetical protein
VRTAGLLALLLFGLLMARAPAAWASCAPDVGPSPYAFRGTVVETVRQGRVATVRTDEGHTVVVRGTPVAEDPPGLVGMTTVDRRYDVGRRYEFHPVTASDPFEDNACTQTRDLPPLLLTATDAAGTARPSHTWVEVLVAGGLLAAVALGLLVHRAAGAPSSRGPGRGS